MSSGLHLSLAAGDLKYDKVLAMAAMASTWAEQFHTILQKYRWNKMRADEYFRAVRLYHGLLGLVVVTLIGVFPGVFFLTGNPFVAGLVAAGPSTFLLWRWIRIAKRVDQSACPRCGQRFPEKLYWIYPPKQCPNCGERVR